MEELKFVSLKTRDPGPKRCRATRRRIGNGIARGLAICFASIIATTLLMSLCLLLSTCAAAEPDPSGYASSVDNAFQSTSACAFSEVRYPTTAEDFSDVKLLYGNRDFLAVYQNVKHLGRDIAYVQGTAIHPIACGKIVFYSSASGYGTLVVAIEHELPFQMEVINGDGKKITITHFISIYGHQRADNKGVKLAWKVGDWVGPKDVISYVQTDALNGDGPEHLHFGTRIQSLAQAKASDSAAWFRGNDTAGAGTHKKYYTDPATFLPLLLGTSSPAIDAGADTSLATGGSGGEPGSGGSAGALPTKCVEGEQVGCLCPGGLQGVQRCDAQGIFGACVDCTQLTGGAGGIGGNAQGGASGAGGISNGGSSGCGGSGQSGCGGTSIGGSAGTSTGGMGGSAPGICKLGNIASCYPGPSGTLGLGSCKAGTQICIVGADQFEWSSCQGATVPVPESCNNLDDDCDGFVDQGNPGGQQACIVAGQTGPCTSGLTFCSNGAMLCLQTVFSQAEQCANASDDDCDGLADCQDPDCASVSACAPVDAGSCSGEITIHLSYQGPAWSGTNALYAWWMPPGLPPRPWGIVDECVDTLANDGKLDCVFHVPHCSTSLEFQVFLPYNRYWGDMSCSANGGCGSTIGSLTLDIQGVPLSYNLKSNGYKDLNCTSSGCDPYPYKNGLADFVP